MTTVECYQNCDVSSVEIIKDLRNKLESYTNEYNIYKTAQLHLDTLNFENNIGKVLKRDVYFQGQTLDTINGINYYLIFVYLMKAMFFLKVQLKNHLMVFLASDFQV